MKLVSGKKLTPAQVTQVKAIFVYRYTVDNPRTNTNYCKSYATETDEQWISRHLFWVRKDGYLSARNSAYSWNALPHQEEIEDE